MHSFYDIESQTRKILEKNGFRSIEQLQKLHAQKNLIQVVLSMEGIGRKRVNELMEVLAFDRKQCRNCIHFVKFVNKKEHIVGDGWCTRFPPVFVGIHPEDPGSEIWSQARADLDSFCGEFSRK